MEDKLRNTLRMTYYLPTQLRWFSKPMVYETRSRKDWELAVRTVSIRGYRVVKIERIEV